jgi:hypothetical protein
MRCHFFPLSNWFQPFLSTCAAVWVLGLIKHPAGHWPLCLPLGTQGVITGLLLGLRAEPCLWSPGWLTLPSPSWRGELGRQVPRKAAVLQAHLSCCLGPCHLTIALCREQTLHDSVQGLLKVVSMSGMPETCHEPLSLVGLFSKVQKHSAGWQTHWGVSLVAIHSHLILA